MPQTIVPILAKHQVHGAHGSPVYCPLALAVNDVLRSGFHIRVGSKWFHIFDRERRLIYASHQARSITSFFEEDKTATKRPDHIVLDIPIDFLRKDL